MDTWWQTETGGILITPLPGAHTLKPGSASRPFFGVEPVILRDDGKEASATKAANCASRSPGPACMRTTWGDHDRFIETYFTRIQTFISPATAAGWTTMAITG